MIRLLVQKTFWTFIRPAELWEEGSFVYDPEDEESQMTPTPCAS